MSQQREQSLGATPTAHCHLVATHLSRRRLVVRAASGGAAAGGLLALAACGGEASSAPGGSGSGGAGQPASITFLGRESGSEVTVYKQGIEQFNAAQSRVRVTHEQATGNFDQKLQTLIAGGTPPDAHYMHSQTVPTYVALGVPASLDAYNRRDKALDGLLPTYSSRIANITRGAQFEVEVVHLPQGKQRVTRTACGGSAMAKAGKAP